MENYNKLSNTTPNGVIYLIKLDDNIYKIGQSSNFSQRKLWLVKDYGNFETISIWEVPDRDFAEKVALGMTRQYTISGYQNRETELRRMNVEERETFCNAFFCFVKQIDHEGFYPANYDVKFICYDGVTSEVKIGSLEIEIDQLQIIANAVLNNGSSFSRPQLARKLKSQNYYHKVQLSFLENGFAKSLPCKKTILTPLGKSFLREVLANVAQQVIAPDGLQQV